MSNRPKFAAVHPDDLTLDEAVVLHQTAGITPNELIAACKMPDGQMPPAPYIGALLYIAALRNDPTVTPADISGMTWPEALEAAADVLLAGAAAHREKAQRNAAASAVAGDAGGIDPAAQLDDLVAKHPELADRLRAAAAGNGPDEVGESSTA